MMNISQTMLVATFTATIFLGSCFAAQISPITTEKITVVTEHLAPFQIVEGNSITGLSHEMVDTVFKKSGLSYEIEAHPWSLSYNRAKNKANVCIYSLGRLPLREDQFQWVGHLAKSSISIYSLATKSYEISSLEEVKHYQTAVIRDDVTHHFLLSKGFVEGQNLYVMDNYDALLTLLELPSRNIDLVLINDGLIFNRFKDKNQISKYKSVYALNELTLDFYLACSLQTSPTIVNYLSDVMKNLEKTKQFETIKDKWKEQMKDTLIY